MASLPPFYRDLKLGILGGGQLGRMMLRAGLDLNILPAVLDPSPEAPAQAFAHPFVIGDFKDEQTVLDFGRDKHVITIEIENVNTGALQQLAADGVRVYPQPHVLALVQDKGAQKQFYVEKGYPTSPFRLVDEPNSLTPEQVVFPSVLKLRRAGYDGRGVLMLHEPDDLAQAFDAPCVLEDAVAIQAELAVIVARNPSGQVATYPVVQMAFHPTANLVTYLFAPAEVDVELQREAQKMAIQLIEDLDMVGLLAVEFFVDQAGKLLINEIAPRVHNSGHHTLGANHTSQFEQVLRAVLDLPLGSTRQNMPAVMVNLLGAEGYSGPPVYQGIEDVLALPGCRVHLYGKAETRPLRKMGHLTILHPDLAQAKAYAEQAQAALLIRTE